MNPDTYEFAAKMQQEIERLRSIAKTMKGANRQYILTIIEILEQECGQMVSGSGHSSHHEKERERSSAVLIDMLNKIELRVKELALSVEKEQTWLQSKESADRIVQQFFIDCQEAEKLIKHYEKRGYITREQMADLNNQLRSIVHTMVGLFRRSETLKEAVIQAFETQIFS